MSTPQSPSSSLLYPALGLGVLSVSFAAIFFVQAQPTDPLVAAGIRLFVAASLLLPFVLRAKKRGRLTRRVVQAGVLGGACYAVHFGAWVASLERTSIAASVTLVASTPILLAVASLFTGKDRPSRSLWVAIGLAVVGLVILGAADLHSSSGSLTGDFLALLGCAAMAVYLLLVRGMGPGLDPVAFSGIACGTGSAFLLGTAAAWGIPIEAASQEALGWLVLAALIPQLIGHLILTWSLRYTTPTVVALGVTCEPVVSTGLGVALLGRIPTTMVGVGCTVTLLAVVVAILAGRERPKAPLVEGE